MTAMAVMALMAVIGGDGDDAVMAVIGGDGDDAVMAVMAVMR
jgi:hypothetical protein